MIPLTQIDADRFWSRVSKSDGCWLWRGGRYERYGQFWSASRKVRVRTHRFAYELATGRNPGPLCVCHHCDEPLCVRPDHLFLGTNLDNIRDRDRKQRQARGSRSGAHTHPERICRGTRNGLAKLTDNDVRQIRKQIDRGVTRSEMSRQYGVSIPTICDLYKRETWGHIW